MNPVSTSLRHMFRDRRFRTCCAAAALSLATGLPIAPSATADDNVVSFHGKAPTADGIVHEFLKGEQDGAARSPASQPLRTRGIRIGPAQPAVASAQPGAVTGCPKTNAVVALDVKFDVNSAVLTSDAYRTLRQMAQAMQRKELSACHFKVEGHTDATGNASYNDVLSKKRADSVKQFLLSMNVSGQRLETVGKGSREPLNGAQPTAGENRRVQFRIVGGGRN